MKKILIADDDPAIRSMLEQFLSNTFGLIIAKDGREAIEMARESEPGLALLDINMPYKNGFQVMEELHQNHYPKLPVIFITAGEDMDRFWNAFFRGAEDYIVKPFDLEVLLAKIDRIFKMHEMQDNLIPKQGEVSLARAWGRSVSFKDEYTGFHSERVALISVIVANALELPSSSITTLLIAALTHDVGKIGVRDNILLKQGPLNELEWEYMKSHALMTRQILSEIQFPNWDNIAKIAGSHHESWAGDNGYPDGLKGDEIPFLGRIIAVADIWDALNSKRTYKAAYPTEQCLEIMEKLKGNALDPDILKGDKK